MIVNLGFTVLLGLSAISTVAMIGKPRQPVTVTQAVVSVIVAVLAITLVWALP